MFAARANQENTIYKQQTAASTKNQGLKGLAPKTPAKTALASQRNNENAPSFTVGKGPAKNGKLDQSAFVTPAGPRNRAPLGIKTTNAKALQTPGPPATQDKPLSGKPSSPRLRRPKIKIHEALPAEADNVLASDEDDIEYMPPRGVPLPDHPDDIWPHDRQYPQLQGQNLTRGWFAEYRSQEGDERNEDELSDLEEKWEKLEESRRKPQTGGGRPPGSSKTSHQKKVAPSTLRAQNAASALANRPNGAPRAEKLQPSSKPTSSTSSALNASRRPEAASANPRFTAAKVASRNTIGYSKGRTVSSFARKPISQVTKNAAPSKVTSEPSSADPSSKMLDDLLRLGSLDVGSGDEDDVTLVSSEHRLGSLFDMEDELDDFQLDDVE